MFAHQRIESGAWIPPSSIMRRMTSQVFLPGIRKSNYAVVIKGVLENFERGVAPVKLAPGSYWYQVGKKAHTTSCVSKTPCEIFIVQAQKFDAQFPPVER